jgi:hypothetical protein
MEAMDWLDFHDVGNCWLGVDQYKATSVPVASDSDGLRNRYDFCCLLSPHTGFYLDQTIFHSSNGSVVGSSELLRHDT